VKLCLVDLSYYTNLVKDLKFKITEVPWFPHVFSDLNLIGKNTLKAGESLINESHPGFSDKE